MASIGHTTAFRWYDCQWPWAYFKVIGLFHIKFLKNGVWYGKSYYRQLIGNHTIAFNWCHFWWPWSTFEGHFSLGCHFHVHFSNPWHAFASPGLPAIAELLVEFGLPFDHRKFSSSPSFCRRLCKSITDSVKGRALVIAPQVDTATAEATWYMARIKQRRTYLPYTLPAVADTHLPTPRGWRVE